jgi:hypothetical protein
MDLICVAGADSSTQGGIIKTSATKYDLDSAQESTLETGHTPGSEHVSSNGEKLNFRSTLFCIMPIIWLTEVELISI